MTRPVRRTEPPFSTANLGIIPRTQGDRDEVVRREAWEAAHPGGKITLPGDSWRNRWSVSLDGKPFPSPEHAVEPQRDLKDMNDALDEIELRGLCPVHRSTP